MNINSDENSSRLVHHKPTSLEVTITKTVKVVSPLQMLESTSNNRISRGQLRSKIEKHWN